jgi:HAD superfamily hydrolase (TIGR01509 family)
MFGAAAWLALETRLNEHLVTHWRRTRPRCAVPSGNLASVMDRAREERDRHRGQRSSQQSPTVSEEAVRDYWMGLFRPARSWVGIVMASESSAGVLFDVDGTLVDSTYFHTVSWWQAFRQFDLTVSSARIHRAIGMGSDHILDHLLGEDRDHQDDDKIADAQAALHAAYWPVLQPTSGARDLLSACARRGLRTVLASSAQGRELAALRRAINADDFIDEVTAADDADSSKPSPDIVQVALDKAGLSAARAVFVGDAVWDVHACRNAGVRCIGLTCGGTGAAELLDAGAIAIYDNPATLLAEIDTSVLATLWR